MGILGSTAKPRKAKAAPELSPFDKAFVTTMNARLAAIEAQLVGITERLNGVDVSFTQAVADAKDDAENAARLAVSAHTARLDGIEANIAAIGLPLTPSET